MDNTSREFRKVHVAQPGFLASELLSVGIENFMKSGVTSPRILFLASRRVLIDHEEYFDKQFLQTLATVRHDFSRHNEHLVIDPKISIKLMGSGALRFQVRPIDNMAFHKAIDELDVLPEAQGLLSGQGFIGPRRHFLQASIAGSLLGSKEEMIAAARNLRERLADPVKQQFYTVQADDLKEGMAEVPSAPRVQTDGNTL